MLLETANLKKIVTEGEIAMSSQAEELENVTAVNLKRATQHSRFQHLVG